jgi:phosphatidylglycerol lysyltransferase
VVTETTPADPAASTLDLELGELLRRFRATRSMPLMGFLVTLPSAWHADGARLFVARRDGHLVGIARLLPVPLRGGWFVEHVLRDPRAPNGTVELLIDGIMRWAAATGCSWLTLGLAPLGGDVPTPLRIARRRLRWLYDFEGLARFKSKLRPSGWTPIYLAFPRSQGTTISVIDALAVFAPGGFLAFGLRFLRRGPPIVLGVLAASLAPWTALLVAAPSDHWFQGHTGIKWAWVVFDTFIFFGLLRLVQRPSLRLATLLAVLVTADAVLTPLEVLAWNLSVARGAPEHAVLLVACLAPALAAVTLWGAVNRLRQVVPVVRLQ